MGKSIPWVAFVPLLLGQISEAAVNYSVFPYLPSFIASLGKTPAEVSFYTGLAESALLAMEAAVALPVARLSDKWGRRPLFLGTLMWLAVTSCSLGFSKTVTGIVIWRLLAGVNATRPTSRTMFFEITNDENRVSMLAIFQPAAGVGALFGFCGGVFAEPEGRIPLLGDMTLFKTSPYLLPGLVVAVVPLAGVISGWFMLQETRKGVIESKSVDRTASHQAIRQPGMIPLLSAIGVSIGLDNACNAAIALLCTLAVEEGGLGLSLQAISWTLCFQSITYMIITPSMLKYLTKRYSKTTGLTFLIYLWPTLIPSYALMIYHARHTRFWVPIDIVVYVLIRNTSGSIWSFYDLLVMELSSAELLASSNGWYTIFAAVGGAAGPVLFGAIFAWSIHFGPGTIGGNVIWVVLLMAMFIPLPLIWRVRRVIAGRAEDEEAMELLADMEGLAEGEVLEGHTDSGKQSS